MAADTLAYLRIIGKRLWLIALILVVTIGAIPFNASRETPVYRAYVKRQVIAPEPQEVSLFSPSRPVASREEIVAVQQQFDAALRSA